MGDVNSKYYIIFPLLGVKLEKLDPGLFPFFSI